MSIKTISKHAEHLIGLSSDTKPFVALEGMEFDEVNTGINWIYHEGYWYEDLRLIYALSQALNGGK